MDGVTLYVDSFRNVTIMLWSWGALFVHDLSAWKTARKKGIELVYGANHSGRWLGWGGGRALVLLRSNGNSVEGEPWIVQQVQW